MRIALCFLLFLLNVANAASPRELTWDELIPADAPPQIPQLTPMHNLNQLADVLNGVESSPAALQQYPNAPVVQSLNGKLVKLPGYIVPLDVTEEGRVPEFLLVPYFGACIHVPPPPSNQIVHVTTELGVPLDMLYQPFWVEGNLKVEKSTSDLAEVGYQMAADKVYIYEFPEN
ncbi:hypothetical protein AXE65_01260 [Ventosimonas gracilis]|uniref:DUF3299 domain-containing protein n=1 Tax=Ventosimonas gracilis TaxID=1680762 RepID=A0A139SVB1_9GAMM|nr:DUF3299 domain-containing protein [Ventosimonas gracilis]KXU38372.1 hypothetical protein AXE65_01260 [Ventosimonas gracilis]